MTPIEKLISDLEKFCASHGSYGRQERGAVQLILGEFESANDNQTDWVENATENMADHILSMRNDDVSKLIEESESDNGSFIDGYRHGLEMAAAYIGGVEAATVKRWTPPWPLKIPDWANWLAVDSTGLGTWFECEPVVYRVYEIEGLGWKKDTCDESAGYFEIPPGVDWRTMKVQVKKDGVLLR